MDQSLSTIEVAKIWPAFFPRDTFHPFDARLSPIKMFKEFFETKGNDFVPKDLRNGETFQLDLVYLENLLEFNDFASTLRSQPNEVIGCMVS